MSNYDNHYHPNSQVSEAEMDSLYTVLDDEQAAIVAHAKLVGKQRTYRMPVGQHPADVAALLDAAKAKNRARMMKRTAPVDDSMSMHFINGEVDYIEPGAEVAEYEELDF